MLDDGNEVGMTALLDEYRDVADELQACIDTVKTVQRMAGPTAAESACWAGVDTSRVHGVTDTLAAKDAPPAEVESAASGTIDALPDRYRIERLLGHGAMGSVYLAYDQQLGRHVALKTPKFAGGDVHEMIERFYREARAAATLRSPNICPIYDMGEAEGVHYISMAYIEGKTLSAIIREQTLTDPHQIAALIRALALALQKAHEEGVVHRDLKPGNVMMDADGEPIVMDFGLARRIDEETRLTQSGALVGSPAYMSPEQIGGKPEDIGPAADIYSLGVIMYELLTGRLPFEGSILSIIGQIGQNDPPPPSQLQPHIGADSPLEQICLRMMAKRPEDRYASMAEVAAALDIATAIPPSHREVRRAPTPARVSAANSAKKRRSPIVPLAGTAVLLLVFCGVLAGVIVVLTDQGRLVIRSEVGDVKVIVKQGGNEVATIDASTGSRVRWLATGRYEVELVGDNNSVRLDKTGFEMTRLGNVIVTARWNTAGVGVVRSFKSTDPVITHDGVSADEGGWKIVADKPRSVRLFEVPDAGFDAGPFHYRAKLKTENVKGKAYLEMWVRIPGMGEFFSKGLHMPLSGSNGWAEYEIPFLLEEGQHPDLIKLNVTIEGTGTVWIKDIELRGRVRDESPDDSHDQKE
jgi:predicted Ser/Thr protein kinase